jgi:hypothetical protein
MSQPLAENYHLIRGQGESFAFSLARQVIAKPQPSAWIIFLPFLVVYYLYLIRKYKSSIRSFARDIMHFKFLVLEGALEEARTGVFPHESITAGFRNSGPEEMAREVSEKKTEEMEILRQHYLLLLGSDGKTYPELLRKAYGTAGNYRFFLNQLFKAEKAVYEAVIQAAHPTPEANEVVALMKKASEKLRELELKAIFG